MSAPAVRLNAILKTGQGGPDIARCHRNSGPEARSGWRGSRKPGGVSIRPVADPGYAQHPGALRRRTRQDIDTSASASITRAGRQIQPLPNQHHDKHIRHAPRTRVPTVVQPPRRAATGAPASVQASARQSVVRRSWPRWRNSGHGKTPLCQADASRHAPASSRSPFETHRGMAASRYRQTLPSAARRPLSIHVQGRGGRPQSSRGIGRHIKPPKAPQPPPGPHKRIRCAQPATHRHPVVMTRKIREVMRAKS